MGEFNCRECGTVFYVNMRFELQGEMKGCSLLYFAPLITIRCMQCGAVDVHLIKGVEEKCMAGAGG